jgi:hypothetical protein
MAVQRRGEASARDAGTSWRRRPRQTRSRGRRPLLRIWIPATAILFCLFAMWSFVTPIGAASDEGAQLIKAVSVAHGQILGPAVTPRTIHRLDLIGQAEIRLFCATRAGNACFRALTLVTVPRDFGDFTSLNCDAKETVPAGCGKGLDNQHQQILATTYVGRYPPFYYAVVGLPSLAMEGDAAVYSMRLLSDLLSALFVGLAFGLASLFSRSPLLLASVGVVCTPMVMVFSSTVNPSGFEMATAVCVWTGGLALVLDHSERPPRILIASTGLAATAMVLSRGLSPFWLLVTGASLAALAPRAVLVLARNRSVRLASFGVAAVSVMAVAYVFWAHALDVLPAGLPIAKGTPVLKVVELAVGRTDVFYQQAVGAFGWQETSPPLLVLGAWMAAGSLIVLLGLISGSRRHVAVVLALIVASFVVPVVLMVSQYSSVQGLVWQARDGYPLFGGVILVAGAIAFRKGTLCLSILGPDGTVSTAFRRIILVIAIGVGIVQLGDVLWALRRYSVGLGTTVNPFDRVPGNWSPPIGTATVVAICVVAVVAYGWWIVRLSESQLRLYAGAAGADVAGAEAATGDLSVGGLP